MKKLKVKIIDQDANTAEYTQYLLQNLGYTPIIGTSTKRVDILAEKPDIILMNLDISKKNGDFLFSAESMRSEFNIPLIYLLDYLDDEDIYRATETSPYGFLMKPFEKLELHIAIQAAIQNFRNEQALRASEERHRMLTMNSSDITEILGEDGIILFESAAVERILGYNAGTRLGEKLLDYVHPDDRHQLHKMFMELLSLSSPKVKAEFRVRHVQGHWLVFESIGCNLVHDPAIRGLVLNTRDITERKKAEEEIRRIGKAVDGASDAICILDPDGKMIYQNQAFEDLFGYTLDEMNQENRLESLYSNPDTILSILETAGLRQSWVTETPMRNRDNERLIVSLRADVIRSDQDQIEGIVCIHTNTTDQRAIEKEIAELEKRNSVLAMAVTANHEINQPLMVINANIEMLHSNLPDDVKKSNRRYFDRATIAIERIRNILDSYKQLQSINFDEYTTGTQMVKYGNED